MNKELDALSDEFQSTFTIIRTNPTVIANLMAPNEVEMVKELIKKHLKWKDVCAVPTCQLEPSYDIYYFSEIK
jgi:ribosomal protein L31E